MSNNEEEKPGTDGKGYPLDLAGKLTDGKSTPLLLPSGGPLRSIRILPQAPAAITTSIVAPGTMIKQGIINAGATQPQVAGNIMFQRQITLPVVGQTASHLPRGTSVVANLSAPRSNVAGAIRGPLVVTAQAQPQGTSFVKPTRTASPAQGATWINTCSANGSQVKGVPAVLSSSRGSNIATGKPTSVMAKPQVSQIVSAIKPNATILQSAIIGQNQLHQFKTALPGIQTLNTTVSLAQVVPARAQTLVYSTGTTAQFASNPRIPVTSTVQRGPTTVTTRPMAQVTATRLSVPVSVGTARLLAPQGAVLTPAARITAIPSTQVATTSARIISAQTNVSVARLAVTMTNTSSPTASVNPLLTQGRSALVHSVVPVSNTQNRGAISSAKVLSQPTQAIHLAPMPSAALKTTLPVAASRAGNPQTTIVAQRAAVVSSHSMPISKVYSHQEGQNLYIQTQGQQIARRTSPGLSPAQQSTTAVMTTAGPTYSFYDNSGNFSIARTYPQQGTTITAISQSAPQKSSSLGSHGIVNPAMVTRFNPIMVVESPNRNFPGNQVQQQDTQDVQNAQQPTKMTSSPRPSILRKREHDSNTPLKAAKNLMSGLANMQSAPLSPSSPSDSRNNGHSSGGSTTISATSSPGLADANDDSNQHMPMNKEEEENRPPLEMSPRKKPRKQNLAGNDLDENNDDMQFISERDLKREQEDSDGLNSEGPQDGAPELRRVPNIRKPASASLLNSYKQTWKTTNNHYLRYSDVRPKDERRPTIIDLSNQYKVLEKVNGWKIHHLSTQMEDLADEEHTVHNQLSEILEFTEKQDLSNPEINRITELIKGNMQRGKIIKDGMIEANAAIMKIFDHKVHVTDIITRCASKRNYKKREKT